MKKLLIALGVVVVLLIFAGVFFWWNEITPADFFKTPVQVLDDTVYAAQEQDLEGFKRGFTKDTRRQMDKIHESNKNRPPEEFIPELHWTWEYLQERMAKEGGFEVVKEPDLLDRLTEKVVKVTISFDGREKIYVLKKEMAIWRIDLTETDPGFKEAADCVRDPHLCRRGHHQNGNYGYKY